MTKYYTNQNGELWDDTGNKGMMADADPLYQQYLAHLNNDGEGAEFVESEPVPEQISLAQFHAGLKLIGMYDLIVQYIDSMPDSPEKIIVSVLFQESQFVDRNDPLFLNMPSKLKISDAQIDEFFIAWSKL